MIDPSSVCSEEIDGRVAYEIGNYNALLKDCPAYKKCKFLWEVFPKIIFVQDGELGFEESHELFRGAFTEGFPWEVLKVLVGLQSC